MLKKTADLVKEGTPNCDHHHDPLAVADICRCLHNYNGVLQVAGFIIITIVLTVVLIIIVLFSLSSITSLFVSISVLLDQNGRQPLKTIEINGCLTPN